MLLPQVRRVGEIGLQQARRDLALDLIPSLGAAGEIVGQEANDLEGVLALRGARWVGEGGVEAEEEGMPRQSSFMRATWAALMCDQTEWRARLLSTLP